MAIVGLPGSHLPNAPMHATATSFKRLWRNPLDAVLPWESGDSRPHDVARFQIETREFRCSLVDQPPEIAVADPRPSTPVHGAEKLDGD